MTSYMEGDLLVLRDGSIWIVKGCTHPEDGAVAVPRFVNGLKIKTLSKSMSIVRRYYSYLLKFVPEIGKVVPVVKNHLIIKHLKPLTDGLPGSCLVRGPRSLISAANELIRLLRDSCKLSCGVTGSILGGYADISSDIDLVCMDRSECFECLRKLRREGLLKPMSAGEFSKELPLIKELMSENHLRTLACLRITQGTYKGFRYTLKLLNCSREDKVKGPYSYSYDSLVLLKVTESDYRTPSIYSAEVFKPNIGKSYLITYRVRLTELPRGSIIFGLGRLYVKRGRERIISFDGENAKIFYVMLP